LSQINATQTGHSLLNILHFQLILVVISCLKKSATGVRLQ